MNEKELSRLKISLKDTNGNYKGLEDLLKDLTNKLKEEGEKEMSNINIGNNNTIVNSEIGGENKMKTIDLNNPHCHHIDFNNYTYSDLYTPKRGFEFVSTEQAMIDFKMSDEELNSKVLLKLPKRGTSKSAGYDIFAPFDIILQPNEEINVPTGLKAYMRDGEVLLAFPRSGLGFKYYCRMANTIPVIDSDYYNNPKNEGHMFVKLRNEGTKEMIIKQSQGMCQMIFMPFLLADNDSFDEGETRQGGFGSTTKVKE